MVIALLQPVSDWRALLRRTRGPLAGAAAAIALGGLACVAWILLAKTNAIKATGDGYGELPLGELANGQIVWALQTIAAFPLRNNPAPVLVYLLWLVPFVGLLVAGLRRGDRRLSLVALVLLATWVAVPVALSFVAYSAEGLAWQGRYALPLAVGFPALAGLALSRSARGPRRSYAVAVVALCALAQTISCVRVAWMEVDKGLSPTFAAGVPGALVIIGALALAGALLPLLLARRESLRQAQPTPTPTPTPAQARSVVGV